MRIIFFWGGGLQMIKKKLRVTPPRAPPPLSNPISTKKLRQVNKREKLTWRFDQIVINILVCCWWPLLWFIYPPDSGLLVGALKYASGFNLLLIP